MSERLITTEDVRAEMVTNGFEFSSVTFIKRSDGSTRVMNYRLGVTKHLRQNGKGQGYDPKQHNLITVYDMTQKGYRSIPIDGVLSIRKGNETLTVS